MLFWKAPLYAREMWCVSPDSPPRKCHEMLGPDDKARWEDAIISFMKSNQLPVRNMHVCVYYVAHTELEWL